MACHYWRHLDQERREYLVYPKEIINKITSSFFKRSDDPWHYSGIESLKTLRLGIIRDYQYEVTLDRYLSSAPPEQIHVAHGIDGLGELINMLHNKRFRALVEDEDVFRFKVQSMGLASSDFAMAGRLTAAAPIYIGFSQAYPHSQKLADILDEKVRSMRASGELEKIFQKYSVKDRSNE